MEQITNLTINHKDDKKAVLVEYFQSETLYILRNDGSVISTDNMNGIYSITTGENLTKEFTELFDIDLVKMTQEEYDVFEEKVQQFLNKTQEMDKFQHRNEDIQHFLKELNDDEALLVVRHANCL